MSVQTHILEASGNLKDFHNIILDSLDFGIKKINSILPLPNIDVVVEDNPGAVIAQTGVGGSAPTKNLVHIYINPDFNGLSKTLHSEIVSTLAHELHHCARESATGNPRKNLLEALITDGLADYFDIEITGEKPRPWSIAVTGKKLEELLQRAKLEFQNEKYNHQAWFFGSDLDNIPLWTGYSLGFYLVGEYLKKSGKKASELYAQEAKEFVL